MDTTQAHHLETIAVHAGVEPDPATGAIMTPIYQTSTFAQDDVGVHKGYEYSRSDNPTRTALQKALAALEGGRYGLSYASGLAAIDNVLRLVQPGQHVLSGDDVYGGTYRLFQQVLAGYGVGFSYVDMSDVTAVAAAIQPNTQLVWLETPTNPMLRLTDIAAVAEIAHAHDAWL
ncbi:MAG TPA: cystathionine gamma-synthase, partial [Anaerolineae bacterium]|nr:cystathionine gamma-synthase [Anaerolineae bacterium]